jgi:VanZ family protein
MKHQVDDTAKPPVIVKPFAIVLAVVIVVIIYGSLFPFEFRRPAGPIGAVGELVRTWNVPPNGFGDLVANVLLYTPLGFFEVLVFPRLGGKLRIFLVALTGLALCTMMELTQFYDVGRVTNFSDIYLDTLGATLGAISGLVLGGHLRWEVLRGVSAKPGPVLLVAAFLGYRLFPYVPTTDLHKYWNALKPLVLHPTVSGYDVFRYAVVWLTIAYLIETVEGFGRSRFLYPLGLGFVLFAKVLIVSKEVTPSELIGAFLAYLFWLGLMQTTERRRSVAVALLLFTYVVAERLEPFQFRAVAGRFSWIPFLSTMSGSMEADIQAFIQKVFLYGSLLKVMVDSGIRYRRSTIMIALVLLGTSVVEIYLPDRSAEVTDAVMAIIIGSTLALVDRASIPRSWVA